MTQHVKYLASACLLIIAAAALQAAPQNLVLNKQRIDYRDLGQKGSNLIEPDDSRITALAVDRTTGRIYGATSGKRSQIFAFEPATNHLRPLGILPGAGGVNNAVVVDSAGAVYFGTGMDMTAPARISRDYGRELGHDHVVRKMWADLVAGYENYEGGHVYRFDPSSWDGARYAANDPAEVTDLGVAVPGEGIYCMTLSIDGSRLYGVTYPHGRFFVFDPALKKTTVIGDTWTESIFSGPRRGIRTLPRALALDAAGNCYYSTDGGWLARYNASTGKLERLDARLPGDFYLIHYDFDIYHPVVTCWTSGARGELYGGTNDGYLFRFEPEAARVTNLGKVRIDRRMRALATAADGRIYGVAGENEKGCTLFHYEPCGGGYTHYGPLEVDRSPIYAWNPHNFSTIVTGLDGTLYLGEEERKGHLFIVIPLDRRSER
ncbi:MAG: hypothetical protein FVQ81_10180 [Candidatus Glassbacteria bacterium]|nr:hypothetical protein [Candidatus Glassbacteria bacterium]